MASPKNKPKRPKLARDPKPQFRQFSPNQSIKLHISMSHEKLLARVIIMWAKLENGLHDFIWTILKLAEADGRILTKNVGAKMLIPMARALAERYLTENALADIHLALDKADMHRENRDFIAHGSWATLMPQNVPMAASIKPEMPEGVVASETFPEGRMLTIIKGITEARDTIFRIRNEVAASREKSAEAHHPDLAHRGINPERSD